MILDRFRLTDQAAIVTGAGRGIGRGIAIAFAEAGADVVCVARTQSEIDATAAEVVARGRRALALVCDVNHAEQIDAVVARTMAEWGRIDVLVNNAGGSLPSLALLTSAEEFDAAFHFNTTSALMFSQRAAVHMIAGTGGSIVNISSAMSRVVDKAFVAYGSAKAALSHMSRLLACEWAPRIRVNALAVGSIDTDALSLVVQGELREKMIEMTPMARIGLPEDVAAAALYLASPAAAWVTGKVFEIDGGTPGSNWPYQISAF